MIRNFEKTLVGKENNGELSNTGKISKKLEQNFSVEHKPVKAN